MSAVWTWSRRALLNAAAIIEDGRLDQTRNERYAGWNGELATAIANGDLATLADLAVDRALDPKPRSGQQERLENLVGRYC